MAKDEAELQGLYPPTKVAPTNPKGDKEYGAGIFTDDDRRGILRAVVERFGPRTLSRMLAGRWASADRFFPDPAAVLRETGHPPDPWQAQLLASLEPRILVLCCANRARAYGRGPAC